MVQVASFDGTNDYAVANDSTTLRSPSSAITVAGWMYRVGAGAAWSNIVSKNLATGTDPYSSYTMFQNSTSTGQFVAAVNPPSTSLGNNQVPSTGGATTVPTGVWKFYALTWSSAGGSTRFRIWNADGTSFYDQSRTITGTSIGYDAGTLVFGGNSSNEAINARMARWGIHNALLSDADLATWRTTGTPPVTCSGGFWSFDGVWTDSAQGNTLTATNGATFVTESAPPWSAATTVSGSDSGTVSESVALSVTRTSTDSGTLTDSSSLNTGSTFTGTDSGSLTDSSSVVVTGATLSGTDSGTLTDASALVVVKTATDSFLGDEVATSVLISDSAVEGTLTDASALTATAALSDSGAASDSSAVTVVVARTDSAAMSDVSTVTVGPSSVDSASLGESVTVAASSATSDAATLSDQATLAATRASTDAGTVTDSSSLVVGGSSVNSADAATLGDAAVLAATASTSDTAALAESASILVVITRTDALTGSDSSSLSVGGTSVTGTDGGNLTEASSLVVSVSASDAAVLAESAAVAALLARTDVATFGELAALETGLHRTAVKGALKSRRWSGRLT